MKNNYYFKYIYDDIELILRVFTSTRTLTIGPTYFHYIPMPQYKWDDKVKISFSSNVKIKNLNNDSLVKLNNMSGYYYFKSIEYPSINKYHYYIYFRCDLNFVDNLVINFDSVKIKGLDVNVPKLYLDKKSIIYFDDRIPM